ncbi:CcdC protein domain-containing protein [Paenibacillus terrigena]|uniref:CcdC protein domain-containing protein n=1 Tax=Paenibacillus terrigena TaxID=369333 RepID=UPI00037CC49C|nr:CcdC protein domain-containing protein [Paenibacillus terrigena]
MSPINSMFISMIIFFFILRGLQRGMNSPIAKSGLPLVLPILYISTSMLQLLDPNLHIQSEQLLIAALAGMVLSIPLILTTNFEVREAGNTFIKCNKLMFLLLITIFALRFIAIATVKGMDPGTLSFLLNFMTFSYIVCWRVACFVKFHNVRSKSIAA